MRFLKGVPNTCISFACHCLALCICIAAVTLCLSSCRKEVSCQWLCAATRKRLLSPEVTQAYPPNKAPAIVIIWCIEKRAATLEMGGGGVLLTEVVRFHARMAMDGRRIYLFLYFIPPNPLLRKPRSMPRTVEPISMQIAPWWSLGVLLWCNHISRTSKGPWAWPQSLQLRKKYSEEEIEGETVMLLVCPQVTVRSLHNTRN